MLSGVKTEVRKHEDCGITTDIAMSRLNLNNQSSTTTEVEGVRDILFTDASIKSAHPYYTIPLISV